LIALGRCQLEENGRQPKVRVKDSQKPKGRTSGDKIKACIVGKQVEDSLRGTSEAKVEGVRLTGRWQAREGGKKNGN